MKTKLFTTSAMLATLLFSGCGGGTADSGLTKQPHDTSKLGRTVAIEKDWTWDVSFSADISGRNSSVQAHFWEGVPDDIENFQTFIDMDSDDSTGYSGSNGWEIHGADYLIENGDVYKSMSISEWKWKIVGSFQDIDYKRLKGQGKHEILDMSNVTPTLSNIFTTNNFKVMIEAYDKNWKGDCNTITGVVADVSGVDLPTVKKVLVKESTDKNNDGVIDSVISYTYHDNGKLKTKNNGRSTSQYNEHGDLVKYSSDSPDLYRYFYNSDGKIEKKETLNADGTVKSFLRYEYNSHGDDTYLYINNDDKPSWYSKYEYNADGKLLKEEDYSSNDSYEDELQHTNILKYDNQNRVIEYYSDTYDSQPIHYTKSYNSEGKEVKRIDLSSDDDGVSHDSYYEYDSEGYLKVERIDSYEHSYQGSSIKLKRGDTDSVIYYEWK